MPQPKKKAQAYAEGREFLDAWIRSEPSRPVYSAIRAAFIERFPQYYQIVTETVSKSSRKKTLVPPNKLARLDKECMQLAGLLFDQSNVWAAQDWRKPPIVKFMLRAMKRGSKGHPATMRRVALQALELRLKDPERWKWRTIPEQLCRCGSPEHDLKCQENIRTEAQHLKKLLKNLRIRLSAPVN